MNVQEISFPSPDGNFQLYGNLSLPPLPPPPPRSSTPLITAILIVCGSGPIDRDGNAPGLGLNLNTSNRFAEHVTSRVSQSTAAADDENRKAPITQCAVLSYDKRGVGKKSTNGDKNLHYAAGMWDVVNDAVEALRFLSAHPLIDSKRIILLGHSEGAIVLPLICRDANAGGLEPILGCIFYSGFGETVSDATKLQRRKVLEDVRDEKGLNGWLLRKVVTPARVESQYQDFLAKVNADDQPDYIAAYCGLVKHPAKWFREHLAYDSRKALKANITCHCLAVTGGKDVQVHDEHCFPDKAAELVPKAASMEVHRPENLTHVLRCLEGRASILNLKNDYVKMGEEPLDAELISLTDDWCDRILNVAVKTQQQHQHHQQQHVQWKQQEQPPPTEEAEQQEQ